MADTDTQGYRNQNSYGGYGDSRDPTKANGAADAENYYRSNAQAAGQRGAYQTDVGNSMGARGEQSHALELQRSAAYGQQPSTAEIAGKAAMDRSLANQVAAAGSVRGGAAQGAAAYRNAAGAAAGQQQQMTAGIQAGRASEMAQARDAYQAGATGIRQGDLGQAGLQQQSELAQRQLNQQQEQYYEQMRDQVARTQLQANQQAQQESDSAWNAGRGSQMQNEGMGWGKVMDITKLAAGAATGGIGAGASIAGAACGGPVKGGKPVLVGEEGPEIVMPKHDGFVLTAPQTAALRSGSDENMKGDIVPLGGSSMTDPGGASAGELGMGGVGGFIKGTIGHENKNIAGAVHNQTGGHITGRMLSDENTKTPAWLDAEMSKPQDPREEEADRYGASMSAKNDLDKSNASEAYKIRSGFGDSGSVGDTAKKQYADAHGGSTKKGSALGGGLMGISSSLFGGIGQRDTVRSDARAKEAVANKAYAQGHEDGAQLDAVDYAAAAGGFIPQAAVNAGYVAERAGDALKGPIRRGVSAIRERSEASRGSRAAEQERNDAARVETEAARAAAERRPDGSFPPPAAPVESPARSALARIKQRAQEAIASGSAHVANRADAESPGIAGASAGRRAGEQAAETLRRERRPRDVNVPKENGHPSLEDQFAISDERAKEKGAGEGSKAGAAAGEKIAKELKGQIIPEGETRKDTATSDERAKEVIRKEAPLADAALSQEGSAYRYKTPFTPKGQKPGEVNVGPMAQNMAADPVARTTVVEDDGGLLALDKEKLLKLNSSEIASLQRQVNALAGAKKKRAA